VNSKLQTTITLGANSTKSFGAKAEQFLCQQYLLLLVATALSKNLSKYGARCKRCSLKCVVKFQENYGQSSTASFAPFTLCWCLCALHKLSCEIDSRRAKLQKDNLNL